MARLDVAIQKCRVCGSAQTETPYWLDESYDGNRVGPGVDAPARASWIQAQMLIIAQLFGLGSAARVLDFGGGTGLLVRMLRDIGFDAYRYDLYERNVFCPGFDGEIESGWDVITAVEVLEHLPSPADTLRQILAARPKLVVATTEFYRNEGKDWYFFFPETGQHIFYYSPDGLSRFARQAGYETCVAGRLAVLYLGRIDPVRRAILRMVVHPLTKVVQCLLPLHSRRGSQVDEQRYLRARRTGDPEPCFYTPRTANEPKTDYGLL